MSVLDTGEHWFDDAAGRLIRPYTISNGRTEPTTRMELLSMVIATGRQPHGQLGPEHAQALRLCGSVTTVAEVAARLRLPAVVTKILLSDLVDWGVVDTHAPDPMADLTDLTVLETILNALERRI
ncbi:hypothetical protein Aab01nite_81480 [Paractinoplanes abujensis]|uniref:DUF742 domain-containing protein n=1 Tax=Paractinoplanes abujensis TaxID=882441 RepID=A0A7W7G256_9ACTN|nr:DUF742 domain-containing protein [Actinoplanes abujensis]MBB4693354.1 hypothetical protein [Actinoplanes abujensis]GID24558.1 hypothetical protein Aab01nite_81480 [Actinoplanes abujensis]